MDFQSPPPPSTGAPMHPAIKKQNGFFSLLGKVFLLLIIAAVLLGAGYYFGLTSQNNANKNVAVAPSPDPTSTTTPIPDSPTPASTNTKTVKGGLTQGTAFKPYTIQIPQGWTDVRENTESAGIDKLTITKNGYSLSLYQAAIEGHGCIYKGDSPSPEAQSFSDFSDINGKSAQYRRSWNQDIIGQTITYTICQKADDKSYGSLTTFGGISVVSPNPYDDAVIAEIDGMIASLIKQ